MKTINTLKQQPQTTIDCPGCGTAVLWNDDFPQRPFCSQRCKDADFIDWAQEHKRITGAPSYDDIFSENINPDNI